MTLYELINPSDPYTFYAPSIEVAAACAVMLSSRFGASPVDGEGESSPVMFGWAEWLEERAIDEQWIDDHSEDIACAYDSFLIGDAARRSDVESMLDLIPEENKKEWRDARQDRHRSSMNQIGEAAYEKAQQLREMKCNMK